VRVRFAPSPTGFLHIGNARTALVNWLCARHNDGTFILRIEDTDIKRSTKESEISILSDLRWLGLDWDEGPDVGGKFSPYRQSERAEFYYSIVEKLKQEGRAYECYCTDEELEQDRQEDLKNKRPPRYRRRCLDLSEREKKRRLSEGRKASVRFFVKPEIVKLHDLVMGEIEFDASNIGDFVILKSDGKPSYNFAVVVDDVLMEIDAVIRGNDHVSNTPKQIMIYNVLGLKIPQFAHIPMIVGMDGERLSKRHGATSVHEYREQGYLPDALVNYLSLLSWSSSTGDEILSRERLIEEFSFERISKSQAAFDIKKLNWLNGHYIRNSDINKIAALCKPYLSEKKYTIDDNEKYLKIIDAVRGNLDKLSQITEYVSIFFMDEVILGEKELSYLKQETAKKVLATFFNKTHTMNTINSSEFVSVIKEIQKETGIKGKDLWMAVRIAMTGRFEGPELNTVFEIFGPEKSCNLINKSYLRYLKGKETEDG